VDIFILVNSLDFSKEANGSFLLRIRQGFLQQLRAQVSAGNHREEFCEKLEPWFHQRFRFMCFFYWVMAVASVQGEGRASRMRPGQELLQRIPSGLSVQGQ
jgi:hypothetical protein